MEIGDIIQLIIKKRGFSQNDFSELIGKTPSALSQIIKGSYYPKTDTLKRMADVLEIPVELIHYLCCLSNKEIEEKLQHFITKKKNVSKDAKTLEYIRERKLLDYERQKVVLSELQNMALAKLNTEIDCRYYTPELQEFHVGFEYEHKSTFLDGTVKTQKDYDEAVWHEDFFSVGDCPAVERALNSKNKARGICGIRVKYLDIADIESLGFDNYLKPLKQHNHIWHFKGSEGPKLYVWFNDAVPLVRLYNKFPSIFFEGKVKNKSEFRKILVQIGFIDK